MKSQIIDLIRTEHMSKTGVSSLSTAEKAEITRAFNRIVEAEGGLGSLFSNRNKLLAVRDGSDSLRYVDPDTAKGFPTSSVKYWMYLNDLTYGVQISRSELKSALTEVLPDWATVDGRSAVAAFVKGRKSSDESRVTRVRQAALESLGNVKRLDSYSESYSLEASIQFLARVEAFRKNSRAAFKVAFDTVKPTSYAKPVPKAVPKPMTGYLETLASRQTPATKEDLLALPVPGFRRSTRTWGIELEHVDMAGIDRPNREWQAKGDGSLRGAEGVNGDNCQTCRPDRRQQGNSTEPMELLFNDAQRYPDGCTCGDCLRVFVDSFTNLDRVAQDDAGVWRMYKVQETAPAVAVEEPALPATWKCYCTGQTREFVSPILETVQEADLKTLADQLETRKRNDSAGVHVHVGARDLNLVAQAELIRNWGIILGIIEPLFQRSGSRGYCKNHETEHVETAFKMTSPRGEKPKGGNHYDHFGSDRYRTVNLQALESHTTIEFRALGPVYDYEYLIRWATFCRDMINVAKSGTPAVVWQKARTFKDVVAILEKYGKEVGK